MRPLVAAIVGLVFILNVPVQAAPMLKAAQLHSAIPVQPTAGGCGVGWHRQYWRDASGVLHYRCVPN
jgi:hypothetical protein